VIRTTELITYGLQGPYMNQSVPPTKVRLPGLPLVVGCDGRFPGGLRKFYGMKTVQDLALVAGLESIGLYDGPSWFKAVSFLKMGTSTMIRGFVVRWDSANDPTDEEVCLVWTDDGGSSWTRTLLWASGSSIGSTDDMDCEAHEDFLWVFVEGQAPKTVYWDSAGGSMSVVSMGAGSFATTLGALTESGTEADSGHHLKGDGVYQVAYRFYDPTRNIYSGLSAPLTVTLDLHRQSRATGYVYFNSAGGDSGLLVDGDTITVGGRTYEADNNSSITGDVAVGITGLTTIAEMCSALADAINADSGQTAVTATAGDTTVTLEAVNRGPDGNAIALSKSEAGAGTDDLVVSGATLTGGGVELLNDPEPNCKLTVAVPQNTAVVGGKSFADFSALFSQVDVFRSVNLASGAASSTGAILYLEQTVDIPADAAGWDALTISVGGTPDDALLFNTQYNPETDIVTAPPQSGAVARYQGVTFAGSGAADDGGVDICFSSIVHESPEYFSTYNKREGNQVTGKVRRLIAAGDSLFALASNGITHAYKASSGQPLQFRDIHRGRGVPGQGAAHAVGNSLCILNGGGLCLMNGNDGNIGQISAADRIVYERWAGDLAAVSSGYDALMNASFFLHPGDAEILCVYHGTQSVCLLQGANFVWATEGLDIAGGTSWRSFFITDTGKVVSPDYDSSGSGTMWDLDSSFTLNCTVTSSTIDTVTDSSATFGDEMVGALLYVTSGVYRGQCREITGRSGSTLTLASSFGEPLAEGTTFAISPVPWEVRLPRLEDPDNRVTEGPWRRWLVYAIRAQLINTSGFGANVNDDMTGGVYRHGSNAKETGAGTFGTFTVTENPAEAVAAVRVDGIAVEPYLQQISAGTSFELTEAAVAIKMTQSKNVE